MVAVRLQKSSGIKAVTTIEFFMAPLVFVQVTTVNSMNQEQMSKSGVWISIGGVVAWSMGHGARSMEHGAWSMGHGARSKEHGARSKEQGAWSMEHGARS